MSLLLAIVAAEGTAETVAVTGGAGGRRRRNRRSAPPVLIRGRYYDPVKDAYAIAQELREWVSEIEAREAPQIAQIETIEPEIVAVETAGGVVNLPAYVPMYRPGEIEALTQSLELIEARKAELIAWADELRRQMADEDDIEFLLLH